MADNQIVSNGYPQDNLSFTTYHERCRELRGIWQSGGATTAFTARY